jgi:hypothetical protein
VEAHVLGAALGGEHCGHAELFEADDQAIQLAADVRVVREASEDAVDRIERDARGADGTDGVLDASHERAQIEGADHG